MNDPPPFAESSERVNPYVSPQTSGFNAAPLPYANVSQGLHWVGDELYVGPRAELPPQCVFCNDLVDPVTYKSRAIYWQSPWLLFLVLINILVFAIVSLIVRNRCDVAYGYCDAHRRKRFNRGMAAALGFVGGIALIITGSMFRQPSGVLIGVGVLMLLGSLIGAVLCQRSISAAGMSNGFFRLKGFGRVFIDDNRIG